jgi:ribose 5-phosphate isomerase RpiB
MPMNPVTLKAEIKAEVELANPAYAENVGDDMDWLYEAIANAVTAHILANGLVSGTTTCGAGAGTCVATIT